MSPVCASLTDRRTGEGSKWRSALEVSAYCVNSDKWSCLMMKIKSNKSTREAERQTGWEKKKKKAERMKELKETERESGTERE